MTAALCDVSVWIALTVQPHLHHEKVRQWFEDVEPESGVLFCRATQQSFLRLVTTEQMMALHGMPARANEDALAAYDGLIADYRVGFCEEPTGLDARWREYASRPAASPKLWMDAYLAAFARAGGYQLVTTDKAFRQFRGLDLLLLGDEA